MKPLQFLAILSLSLLSHIGYSQTNLDSLYTIWQDESKSDRNRIFAFQEYIWYKYLYSQPDTAIYFADILYDFAEKRSDKNGMARALNIKGVAYKQLGLYPKALDILLMSLKIKEEMHDTSGIPSTLTNIGNIYILQEENDKALKYHEKSLVLNKKINHKKGIASNYTNIGNVHYAKNNFTTALEYYEKSLRTKQYIGNSAGVVLSLISVGAVHSKLGNDSLALDYYERSLDLNQEVRNKFLMMDCYSRIGLILESRGEHTKARKYFEKQLEIAISVKSLAGQKYASENLYKHYKELGNDSLALDYYEQMNSVQDSIYNEENTKKLTRLEMQYNFDRKEAKVQAEQEKKDALALKELQRLKLIRNSFIGGFALVFAFALIFFKQRNSIKKGKRRSDELLLNILPAEIAEELKANGEAAARDFDQVSILFTDFKEFTQLSEILSAKELVAEINYCFKAFDDICEKYKTEKIKTIGDSYMVAGGLPIPTEDSTKNTVLAALEMAEFVVNRKAERESEGLIPFEMRAGIHTGNVVAGIVGVKKFQYDIWGDTVNTASRMESHGEIGKVNISQTTYDLIKEDPMFSFTSRGKVEAKGKGEIEMYFVEKDENFYYKFMD